MFRRLASISAGPGGGRAAAVLWMAGLMVLLTGCSEQPGANVSESGQYLIAARQAISNGNMPEALEALNASIESEPNTWAFLERARINAKQGADQAALQDCQEILKLDPANRDVPWIQSELKKPVEKRFQGRFATPPSFSK